MNLVIVVTRYMASHNAKTQFDYFEKFLGTAFLVKKNSLEIKFLVKKFLGKRFPCYVVSPEEITLVKAQLIMY
jgi:hypothetical protein